MINLCRSFQYGFSLLVMVVLFALNAPVVAADKKPQVSKSSLALLEMMEKYDHYQQFLAYKKMKEFQKMLDIEAFLEYRSLNNDADKHSFSKKKSKKIETVVVETVASVLPDDEMNQPQSRYGLKLGLVGATFQTESAEPTDLVPVLGVSGGFFVNYQVLPFLSLQPEVILTLKGALRNAVATNEGKENIYYKLNYLEVPFLVNLHPIGGVSLYAGPYLSFLIFSDLQANGVKDGEPYQSHSSSANKIDDSEYGYMGGISINIDKFNLDFRVSKSSVSLFKAPESAGLFFNTSVRLQASISL
jgi:hypothetical protein